MKRFGSQWLWILILMITLNSRIGFLLPVQAEALHEPNPYQQAWAVTTEVPGASEVRGLGGVVIQPWFWLFSLLLPGAGQVLMGEFWHGLFYLFAPLAIYAVILVIQGALGMMFATAAVADLATGRSNALSITSQHVQLSGFFTVFGLIMIGLLYVWNGVDAFIMNQDKLNGVFEQVQRLSFLPQQGVVVYQVSRF